MINHREDFGQLAFARNAFEEENKMFGADIWPSGLAANRSCLERFMEYLTNQMLIEKPYPLERLFPCENKLPGQVCSFNFLLLLLKEFGLIGCDLANNDDAPVRISFQQGNGCVYQDIDPFLLSHSTENTYAVLTRQTQLFP